MLTFREIRSCEGYYFNMESGEIVRNVGPGHTRCWSEGHWSETGVTDNLDQPLYELVTPDVSTPFETVRQETVTKTRSGPPLSQRNERAGSQQFGARNDTPSASTSMRLRWHID